MKQSQRIAKNVSVVLISELIGFGLNFLITVFIARHLGTEGFGKYSYILAFVWIFQIIADSGITTIMVREFAVKKDTLLYQFGTFKSLIWASSIIVFLLIVLGINIINPEDTVRNATYIMGLSVLTTLHAVGYGSIFRAMEEMEYNAAGFIIHKVFLLGLVLLSINLRGGLEGIAIAYLISNLLLWMFYYIIVRYRYFNPKIIIDLKMWRFYVAEAIPIGIASILRKISWQVDILILSAISTTASVGLFSAAYKIIQSLNLLPQTVSIPLFPVYSRLAKTSQDELFHAFEKSLKFMFIMSIPLVVLIATLSHTILLSVLGPDFEASSIALQILSFVLIFLFPTAQFVYLFSALNRQRLYTISSLACLLINIILDFILIPEIGFVGACIGTLVAEITLFGFGMYFLKTINRNVSLTRVVWKPVTSGLIMLVILYQFRDRSLYWLVPGIFVSGLGFLLTNIILKTFSRNEIFMIKDGLFFMKKLNTGVNNAK